MVILIFKINKLKSRQLGMHAIQSILENLIS